LFVFVVWCACLCVCGSSMLGVVGVVVV